jgi:hypothetical protein
MSAHKLVFLIAMGLLLVGAVAFWMGRAREGDETRPADFVQGEHEWIEIIKDIAGSVGGLVGIGPSPFDLTRLRPDEGTPEIRCRRRTCEEYPFGGTATLRIAQDDDARYAGLVVRPVRGSVRMTFEPEGIDAEDRKKLAPERIDRGRSEELTVAGDGGVLVLECLQASGCSVRFRSAADEN